MTCRTLHVVLLVALALACAGATRQDPRPVPEGGGDGSYTVLEPLPAFTLDPARMTWDHDLRLGNALYDGLVRWDPYTFDLEPGVAESWLVSGDGLVYTFRLREDARWSTGEPITAQDFMYSWRRLLMPDTGAEYSQLLFPIRGAQQFFEWRREQLQVYADRPASDRTTAAADALLRAAGDRFRDTVGIEAPDPRTLRVHLARPVSQFIDICAYVPTFVVHRQSVEAFARLNPASGRVEQQHGWTKPPRLVSSGAYTLERWRFKRDMLLRANPMHWNAPATRAPSVTIRVIEDPNTRALAFQTGAGDWNTDLMVDHIGDMLRQAEAAEASTLHAYDRFGTYFWSFNCRPTLPSGRENPFGDPRVRRAFALAIDKAAIARAVRDAGERPAATLIPPGTIRGYDPERALAGLRLDPDRARRELRDAGWDVDAATGVLTDVSGAGRGEFPTVGLLCPGGSYHDRVGLALGAAWERELGARTRVVIKESRAIREDLRSGNFMIARGGWFGDFEDPSSFLRIHRTGDGNNDRGYSSPEFDATFDRADAERDPSNRMALFALAERLTIENDMPLLPLWAYRHFYQFDPARLHGVTGHPRLMQRLDRIFLAPPAADDGATP